MVNCTVNLGSTTLLKMKTVSALETSLQHSLNNLKELVVDLEQLQLESNNYKDQYLLQKEKCESKTCVGSEALKKIIVVKENIIQSVASALTKLNETKDVNFLNEAFKILCGETVILTPPKEKLENKLITPKKERSTSITDDLVSEIDATPTTGRTSPIILSKKIRNATATDFREKKKCPDSWSIPENKSVKLTCPTSSSGKPGGKVRHRQMRFTFVKQNAVVDLTSSPEFSGGRRGLTDSVNSIQFNTIKKESFDDEDTIQPSPTSVNSNFSSLYKSTATNNPLKKHKNRLNKITKNSPSISQFSCKRPIIKKLETKIENTFMCNIENLEIKREDPDLTDMEDSINLLKSNRALTSVEIPVKMDPDKTECDINASMSLLPYINKLDKISPNNKGNSYSPTKQPLTENVNCTNLPAQCKTNASTSLPKNPKERIKKKDLERMDTKHKASLSLRNETLFKEPTVRKKAEKWLLPGWSCDECKNFYAELYADDPEMLSKKMAECSKHRGRRDPARPATPPGFWPPRWDVPADTEEFNRRNDAV